MFLKDSNNFIVDKANTLTTARTINGTSFNGSANITTAQWGTARNLQIGNTAKPVNGSANITWSLGEIGAAPASHTHNYVPTSAGGNITVHADSDSSTTTEYLALKAGHNILQITSSGGGSTTTQGQDKLTFNGNIVYHAGRKPTASEIGAAASSHTHNSIASRGNVTCETGVSGRPAVNGLSMSQAYNNGYPATYGNIINLRGTGDGQIFVGWSGSDGAHAPVYVRSKRDNTTSANWSGWAQFYTTANPQTTITGNAGTATTLQTARTINGTSFNGSANITTANWGTARNIYVADADGTNTGAAVSVNGAGNATLKLPSTIKASLSGNASTASSLASARLIGKASFNGSANITLDAIAGRATIPSSADAHANKYSKFARIDVSGGTYRCCSGTLHFVPSEGNSFFGELRYYFRTGSTISSVSIDLRWKNLSNASYANRVFAVKVSDGVYDLYYQPLVSWDTMTVTNVNSVGASYITLTSNQAYVTSITAAVTSSLYSHVSNATAANTATTLATARTINGTNFNGSANITTSLWGTARTITIGSTGKSVNGSTNVSWTLAEIGASRAHSSSHSFGGNQNAITTEQFIKMLTDLGAFSQPHWVSRGSWSYASNQYINDTKCGNIHLAGCVVEVFGNTSAYTIKVTTPTTSSSGVTNGDFVYVNNGSGYSPGWRRLYSTAYKPTASEIGAAASSHTHSDLQSSITSLQNELGTNKRTLEDNVNSIKGVL